MLMTSRSVFNPRDERVGQHRLDDQGFTFLGLILVVMIMAVFAAAFFIAIAPSDSTRDAQVTMQRADALRAGLRKFKLHNARTAPANLSKLIVTTGVACTVDTNTGSSTYKQLKGWCGPYLDQALSGDGYQTDGWCVLFEYDGVTLKSCGPNRTCGNGDDVTYTDF